MEIVTELPALKRHGNQRHEWQSLAKVARKKKNRGKWVKYTERVNVAYPFHITHGRVRAFGKDFEAVGRDYHTGKCDLYVRYRGE